MDEEVKIKILKLSEVKTNDEFEKMVTAPSSADVEALKESIQKEGFHSYLIVMPEGDGYTVIDGHTRLKILKELGYDEVPVLIVYPKDRTDAMALVIRYNLARRQLTPSQRALLVASLENLYKKEKEKAKERQVKGGEKRWNPEIEMKERGGTAEKLADIANVSEKLVRNARKVVESAPHLAEKVKQGEISVNKAVNIIKHEEAEKKIEQIPQIEEEKHPGVLGPFEYKLTPLVKPFENVPKVRNAVFFTPDYPIPDRILDENSIVYFIATQNNLMNTLIQVDAHPTLKMKDIVVFNVSSKTVIFVVKAVKGKPAERMPEIKSLKGNIYDVMWYITENSTAKDERILIFNSPDVKTMRIPFVMNRKVYAVETKKRKFNNNNTKLNDPMVSIDAQKVVDDHEEKVKNPDIKTLIEWLWIKLKKVPQKEYDKFTKPFFVREGTAARELLKLHSLDEIKDIAERVARDKFWGPKLTVKMLYDHWAEFVSMKPQVKFINQDSILKELEDREEEEEE